MVINVVRRNRMGEGGDDASGGGFLARLLCARLGEVWLLVVLD